MPFVAITPRTDWTQAASGVRGNLVVLYEGDIIKRGVVVTATAGPLSWDPMGRIVVTATGKPLRADPLLATVTQAQLEALAAALDTAMAAFVAAGN